jgi:hypothetical protein
VSNTLGAGDNLVMLSDDMVWTNEFDGWSPVVQSIQYAVNGALLVQESAMLAGRLITIAGDATSGWMLRSEVLKLQALAALLDTTHPLVFNGTTYQVRFPRGAAPSGTISQPSVVPYTAKPVVGYSDPDVTDPYIVTINLFQVQS